jgi:prepilin-type N-terminal cleavage/methylation domain-containing protein
MQKSNKVKGFTLVELIVVVAIFSLIMVGALNLVQPSRKMYTNAYNNEAMISNATQLNNYLESTLRYATFVRVSSTMPDAAARKLLVQQAYDSKLKIKDLTHIEPAKGKLYILDIDNTSGGKIHKWTYSYTAGGKFNLDDDTVTDVAITPTAEPALTSAEDCINEAIYNDCNYNISLGMFDAVSEAKGTEKVYKLVQNSDYYTYTGAFSKNNFGFTITAYPRNFRTGNEKSRFGAAGVTATKYDGGDGLNRYVNAAYYSSSICFENMKTSTFNVIYKRGTDGKVEKAEGKTVFTNQEIPVGTMFSDTFTAPQAEPGHIYIMYTYADDEVNK